ncbi:MAG: hypothetical protein HOW73_46725 [Polyangiaceae bacterium]|nr:hypothetical protein [Polyangiaceae bacterium]
MLNRSVFKGLLVVLGLAVLPAGCDKGKDKADASGDEGDAKKKDDKSAKPASSSPGAGSTSSAVAAPTGASPAAPAPAAPSASSSAPAYAHLPADCQFAMTIDLKKTLGHPSLTSVHPIVEQILATPDAKDPDAKKFLTLLKDTGINAKSFHAAALCVKNVGGGKEDVVFVVSGDIKPDSVVQALEKVEGTKKKAQEVDGRMVMSDEKLTVGQYADGSIGFANKLDVWRAASATGDHATTTYKLDTSKELSFNLAEGLIREQMSKGRKAPDELKNIKSARGFIDLTAMKAETRLAMPTADDANKTNALLILMKSQFEKQATTNEFGQQDALKSATSRIDGTDIVIEVAIPQKSLEQGVKALTAELEKAKKSL